MKTILKTVVQGHAYLESQDSEGRMTEHWGSEDLSFISCEILSPAFNISAL